MKQTLFHGRAAGAGVAVFGIVPRGMWVDGLLDTFEQPSEVFCDNVRLDQATSLLRVSDDAGSWFYDEKSKGLYIHSPVNGHIELHTIEVA
jgi:hypothetical protein